MVDELLPLVGRRGEAVGGGTALVDEEVGQVLRDGDGGARVRDGLVRVRARARVSTKGFKFTKCMCVGWALLTSDWFTVTRSFVVVQGGKRCGWMVSQRFLLCRTPIW